MTHYFEAHCLLPHDRRKTWAKVRAATARGLLRKLGGDASFTRCYHIEGARKTRVDLAQAIQA